MKLSTIQLVFVASFFLFSNTAFTQEEKSAKEELKTMDGELKAMDQRLQQEEEIFKVVEQMPRFPRCEDEDLSKYKIEECAKTKMREYIYENLKYPKKAKANGIKGMVVVQFLVNKEGEILNPIIKRDLEQVPGEMTCGEAALEMMQQMQEEVTWIPGKQRGRAVTVQYTLPVKFDPKRM